MAKIEEFAAQMKRFEDAPKTKKAAQGDQVIIDFAGSVDGVAFDGGTGEDMAVEIGSGQLIPGFEDQLVGVKTRSEEHTSELQSLMRISYAVFCLKKKKKNKHH